MEWVIWDWSLNTPQYTLIFINDDLFLLPGVVNHLPVVWHLVFFHRSGRFGLLTARRKISEVRNFLCIWQLFEPKAPHQRKDADDKDGDDKDADDKDADDKDADDNDDGVSEECGAY